MNTGFYLGIELGSTRIKSVLIDRQARTLAQGSYEWENTLVDGLWSYSLDDVCMGVRESFRALSEAYRCTYKEELLYVDAIGISAMMHGYLAFDKDGRLLTPFRTWRNTNTTEAADALSELFQLHIPERWSVSHFYQAVLNGEEHVARVARLTTLSGYVHEQLTGQHVLGVGDASGMFPIRDGQYDEDMLKRLNERLRAHGYDTPFEELLPHILTAGEVGGHLTERGARFLDPSGKLRAGCLLCPPEGDAGTGMVATNCISKRTANVSAGTSAFVMAVLEHPLRQAYKEIDMVTTPSGLPVAMVHINNFASEITAWTNLFEEVIALGGGTMERGALFDALYTASLGGEDACGGMLGYNFLSGEPIVNVAHGLPLIARLPSAKLTLANFMKLQIFSALGSLSIGMEILHKEHVSLDYVCGHGGFFKTPIVGQRAMSAAIGAPITVMESSAEGGAWGMAVLALFAHTDATDLDAFLASLFKNVRTSTECASKELCADFSRFMERYKTYLCLEHQASEVSACWKN